MDREHLYKFSIPHKKFKENWLSGFREENF